MANLKFSGFTANAAVDQADSFLVGFDTDGGGLNPTNNKWTFPQIATGLAAVTATPYSIYAADGTIGSGRVATITDFPKFSGTQPNPIGLEIENTQTGSGAMSTMGAQLNLTSNSATGTIGYFNSGSGGSNAPAMVLDSPGRMLYKAAVDAGHIFQLAHGEFKFLNDASQNYPIFESIVAGGGSNYSEFRLAKTGNNYSYIRSVQNDANNIFSVGRTVSGTYGEAIRINQANQLGINSDGITISETLHVNGNARIDGQAYTELHTGATPADPNWNNSNVQEMTLASLDQDFDPTNAKAGATYILKIKQPSSGVAGTINWNAASATVLWPAGTPPTLSTANNAVDIVTLICTDSASGGTYYANATLNFS